MGDMAEPLFFFPIPHSSFPLTSEAMTARIAALAAAALLAGCASLPNQHTFTPVAPAVMGAMQGPGVQPGPPTGAIYQAGQDVRLFESRTARRVGDIVTIRLVEATNASKRASTGLDKSSDSSFEVPAPTGFGGMTTDVTASATADNTFTGKGTSDQSNSLRGTISAVVVGIYPNGNLLIRGEKMLALNQGEEYVQIQGVVRPEDIFADNSVLSGQIADARITYGGTGALADSNAPGWLTRFFISPFFPI